MIAEIAAIFDIVGMVAKCRRFCLKRRIVNMQGREASGCGRHVLGTDPALHYRNVYITCTLVLGPASQSL